MRLRVTILLTNCLAYGFTSPNAGAPDLLDTSEKDPLLWGPYRSNLYFGLRAKTPKSPLMGLLWSKRSENGQLVQKTLRHACEQGDDMAAYGWTAYDPRQGGSQIISDPGNQINVTTLFSRPQVESGSQAWSASIVGRPMGNDKKSSIIFYVGLENDEAGEDTRLLCSEPTGPFTCTADTVDGKFNLSIEAFASNQAHVDVQLRTVIVADGSLWRAKETFLASYNHPELVTSNAEAYSNASLTFIQLDVQDDFKLNVRFHEGDDAPETNTSIIADAFEATFNAALMPSHPYTDKSYVKCSQALISNLLGGIGYFYGDSKVDLSYDETYNETSPTFWEDAAQARNRHQAETVPAAELFSMVPSRPFFPRGFLWDDGFHLLLALEWDLDLALEVLRGWFALMNEDGWIAREQILGPEARSKVPSEFQVQYPHYANPPTMFLVASEIADIASGKRAYYGYQSSNNLTTTLQGLYPMLKRHYAWFRHTQSGDLVSYKRPQFSGQEGYRWRGRTKHHILTSGLDDYPRAQPPHPGELHVDALSWVGVMAGSLAGLSAYLGHSEDHEVFTRHRLDVVYNTESLHWSEEHQAYCDATISDRKHTLVCHQGYISLFPFMLGLLNHTNQHVGAVLDLIRSEKDLWSPYGIRSLSQSDPYYGTDENYWRSPIWININYLVLKQLLSLAQTSGFHQMRARRIYAELRQNVVNTVFRSWRKTGYAWEQYNPDTGAGQRTQHFTGWTALTSIMMAMPDLSSTNLPFFGEFAVWTGRWHSWLAALSVFAFVIIFRKTLSRTMTLSRKHRRLS